MVIRVATFDDLEPAASVLRNAALRLERSGEQLWKAESFTAANLALTHANDELCVAVSANRVVGTMYLQQEDAVFWPDEPQGQSLFIHKLAVDDDQRGRGISSALIQFARDQALSRGRRWLRLDCADRPKLRNVYEQLGFQYRDTKTVLGFEVCHYELPI